MEKLLTLTKREIEERTVYYVDSLRERSGRRAIAARILGVSLRSIDAWCAPSDPRVMTADRRTSVSFMSSITKRSSISTTTAMI